MTNSASSLSNSTTSSTSSTTISSTPSTITIAVPNISALVTTKLNENNYLEWETQIKPFLIGQKHWRFIDGTYPCPSHYISSSNLDSEPELNTEYKEWYYADQTLIGIINSTLSSPVLSLVVGLNTSKAVWDCLQQNFAQQSLANATQLRFQLLSMTKGDKSIPDYLQYAKSISDSLAAINQPVSPADLVTCVLRGLGSEYSMLVTAIINFPPLPSFSSLRARLLTFESMNMKPSTPNLNSANPTTALLSSHNPTSPHSNRGNSNYRGSRQGRGRNYQSDYVPFNQNYNSYRGGYSRGSRGRGRGRNHFQQGILGSSPFSNGGPNFNNRLRSNTYANQNSPQYHNRNRNQDYTYEDDLSSAFAGLQMAPQIDPTWYVDSGATNHMSGDARSFTNRSEYNGGDQVQLGNGDFLPITHTEQVFKLYEAYLSKGARVVFPNCKALHLQHVKDVMTVNSFAHFLLDFPSLEELHITVWEPNEVDQMGHDPLVEDVKLMDSFGDDRVFKHLKMVVMMYISGCPKQMMLIKFILQKAIKLENLNLHLLEVAYDKKESFLELPKVSQDVTIDLFEE